MAIEITERRRRLVIDWVLVGVIVACCTAFFDLRATVHAQTKAFDQLSHRIEKVETDAQTAPQNTATKGDIARLEGRIDQLVNLMLTKNGR
jgi:outer membrane murein-binding lipoprotein Lpp